MFTIFTPYTTPEGLLHSGDHLGDGRVRLTISRKDYNRFRELGTDSGRSIVVRDTTTGLDWITRPAPCGGDCQCAAFAAPFKTTPLTFTPEAEFTATAARGA